MKNISAITIVLLLLNASVAQASIRSLSRERAELRLLEKVGKTENLLNDPARLSCVQDALAEYDVDFQIQDSKPYDSVYNKSVTQETMRHTAQVVVPVKEWLVLNAGYEYLSDLNGTLSTSFQDQTVINDWDKIFSRKINAAIAASCLPFCDAGYAFALNPQEHSLDYHSDLGDDYTYLNAAVLQQNTLGLMRDGLELYGSYNTQKLTGDYQQIREVDFTLDEVAINARRIFGEVDQENLLLQVGYANYYLEQHLFAIAREGYDLDLPASNLSGAGYYYLPAGDFEIAAGVEAESWERDAFNMPTYAWIHYQTFQAVVPAEVSAQILPWLEAWLEMDLTYARNTLEGSESLTWQNTYGLKVKLAQLEIELYTLPVFSGSTSKTTDAGQNFNLGMSVLYKF